MVVCRLLVPIPKICRENTCVENELIFIVNNFLGGIGRGAGFSVRDCVIYLPLDDFDGVGGGICLAEVLVICKTVGLVYDGVGLVQLGEKIQHAGSSIPSV